MKIHALIVLKKGGVLIYYQEFTSDSIKLDPVLMSSFLTAMIDFSSLVVKEDLNVIDFGRLRLFFKKSENENVTFILMTDTSASVLLIQDRLKLVIRQFLEMTNDELCQEITCMIENDELKERINSIINLGDSYSESNLAPVIDVFTELMSKSDISGGALFSIKGEIFYSNLSEEFLHLAIREVEIRSQVDIAGLNAPLPKFIWQSGDYFIFSQFIRAPSGDFLVATLLFDANRTNLGIADFELESIVKRINDLI